MPYKTDTREDKNKRESKTEPILITRRNCVNGVPYKTDTRKDKNKRDSKTEPIENGIQYSHG